MNDDALPTAAAAQPAHDDVILADAVPPPADARTPRTLGLLNLIYAAVLAAWSGMTLVGLVFPDLWQAEAMLRRQEDQLLRQREAFHRRELDRLDRRAQEANSAEEREAAERARAEVEAHPPQRPDLQQHQRLQRDPRMRAYAWEELLTNAALAVLLAVSGWGLWRLRAWGRRLAQWTAGLKLAQVVLGGLLMLVVIVPLQVEATQVMMEEQAQHGPAVPVGLITSVTRAMAVVFSLLLVAAYAVYPAVSLWLLQRPAVREACRG